MSKKLLIGVLIPIVSCFGATDPTVGQEFVLAVGGSAKIAGVELSVEFLEVVEDSRCPSSVQCVWAGNGAIVVKTVINSSAQPDTLNTHLEPNVLHLGHVQVELVALEPTPVTTGSIPLDAYRATFVTRLIH